MADPWMSEADGAISAGISAPVATAKGAETGSPEWWRARLENRLSISSASLQKFDRYYRGDQTLNFASEKFRKAFGRVLGRVNSNFMALVVRAVAERLDVEGFRLGASPDGDDQAWAIWQANNMDAESAIAQLEALIYGRSPVAVWWDSDEKPLITVESSLETVVETAPGNRRKRLAALKKWRGEDGHLHATLYLPEAIFKWQSHTVIEGESLGSRDVQWDPRTVEGEDWPLQNRLGVVPVVMLENEPRTLTPGTSEIASVISLQDQINKVLVDLMVASEYSSFRQRWATGVEIPLDPETGQKVEPFKAAIDRVWTVKNPDAAFGDFDTSDLSQYVKSIEMHVQHIASQSGTPAHYLLGNMGTFPSGEALRATEAALVKKAQRKMRFFSDAWEEVMRLAFLVDGNEEKANITDSQVIWRDPETRTEVEHVDALMKLQALGVPQEMLWERAGLSPQEIDRAKAINAALPPAPIDVVPANASALAAEAVRMAG